jgi:hypothetical protein
MTVDPVVQDWRAIQMVLKQTCLSIASQVLNFDFSHARHADDRSRGIPCGSVDEYYSMTPFGNDVNMVNCYVAVGCSHLRATVAD